MPQLSPHDYSPDDRFFSLVIKSLRTDQPSKVGNIGALVVAHSLIDAIPYLKAISSLFTINVVFVKPRSINHEVAKYLSTQYLIKVADRQKLSQLKYLSKFINPRQAGFVLVDIGGYFSKISRELSQHFSDKFLGVVEDTENGLRKYLSNEIDFPFLQVARSPLKDNEDYLVGQAISFSVESILRQEGILLNGKRVGIIGYGKIGRGVANAMKMKQAIVSVNDIDPVKITHAYSQGFIPMNRDALFRGSDIVCLATGNHGMTRDDFKILRSGAYLFTVTSSDDEIDTNFIKENYRRSQISDVVAKYSRGRNSFYLINEGNAVNFIHGTTVSSFILLVQSEIIAGMMALSQKSILATEHNYLIANDFRKKIASHWLDIFTSQFNHYDQS